MSSINALTLDKKLVNMDWVGTRVASMIYGHKRVYLIVGKNKLVKDRNEARSGIKNITTPKNVRRLGFNTPCKSTGKCNDCDSSDKICRVETIIHKNPMNSDINIFLVDEDLGY